MCIRDSHRVGPTLPDLENLEDREPGIFPSLVLDGAKHLARFRKSQGLGKSGRELTELVEGNRQGIGLERVPIFLPERLEVLTRLQPALQLLGSLAGPVHIPLGRFHQDEDVAGPDLGGAR